ncbi:MAG: ACP phosphodiesterase [Planctomycetes bacterium]|nr:ACP phosphodiesterase [Planctomycetota bacterium]
MNFLAHLFLSDTNNCMLGNFLGDFVKGLVSRIPYEGDIKRGIILHREIDSFIDSHPIALRSMKRIDEKFSLYSGILVDIFYDHFLAKYFDKFSDTSLEEFAENAYKVLEDNADKVPENAKKIIPRMKAVNWLVKYRELETIKIALKRLSQRIKHKNPLANGFKFLTKYYDEFKSDFFEFFPIIIDFVKKFNQTHKHQTS